MKTSRTRSIATLLLACAPLWAQNATVATPAPQPALRLDIPHSHNPLDTYRATLVPKPNLANTPRLDALVRDGVLESEPEGRNHAGARE